MPLDDVVRCADGIRIAQRHAPACTGSPTHRVGPVRAIEPPTGRSLDTRHADGSAWRRHWSEPARMVIEFTGVALVEVDHGTGVITFDRDLEPEDEQHLLLDHVLPLVLAQRGRVVLHGGVLSRNGLGVALVGSSGAGKSTLAGFAWQRGWVLGGDDGAVISSTAPLAVQPSYPTLRLAPGGVALLGLADEPSSAVAGKHRFSGAGVRALRLAPVELRAVVVLEPTTDDRAGFDRLRGTDAHAELFGSTFHAEFGAGERLRAVVDDLATVVDTAAVGRLTVPRGVDGLAAAELVLRDQLREPSP